LEETSVTVWCPLVDTDEENGTLQVVPGSHKIVPDVANIRCEPFFRPVEEALLARYLEPICLAAGEALIFDDSLIHYSSENRSAAPRVAVQLETVPAEATTVLYYLDPTAPERFELFRVEPEFFTEHGVTALRERPASLPSLGFVANPNRLLDEAELVERLRCGPERRRRIYGEGGEAPVTALAERRHTAPTSRP
jgi:hypothetical protein